MAKKEKRTTVICNDRIAYTDIMDNETAGILFKYMLALRNGQEPPPLPDSLKYVMAHIQSFWSEQDQKYQEKIVDRNKENGKKGGRPPKDKPQKPNGLNETQENPKKPKKKKKPKKSTETLTDTITDINTIYKNIYRVRKEQNIVNHKELSKEIKNSIDKILQELSEEEVITAIKNYWIIYNSEKTFFDYKRTLPEFLSRKNGAKVFLYKSENDYISKDIKAPKNTEEYSSKNRSLPT